MPYTIAKSFRFEASHQLMGMPEGHKCGKLHGHSYRAEVVLFAEQLDPLGMVRDFGDLDPLAQFISTNLDHSHLNDRMEQPTAEAIARFLYEEARRLLGEAYVSAVRVYETRSCWAEYQS